MSNPWTPGPWLIDQPLNEHVVSDDYHVIESSGFQLSGFMSLADATLIASAPALVEALEEMVEAYWGLDDDKNGDGISPPPKCIINARAALSLAKGTQTQGETT